jgi:hypothetical protein
MILIIITVANHRFYPLEDTNQAFDDLGHRRFTGAAFIMIQ